jgi:hypothetical protein
MKVHPHDLGNQVIAWAGEAQLLDAVKLFR